jgi:hypothetical protein
VSRRMAQTCAPSRDEGYVILSLGAGPGLQPFAGQITAVRLVPRDNPASAVSGGNDGEAFSSRPFKNNLEATPHSSMEDVG